MPEIWHRDSISPRFDMCDTDSEYYMLFILLKLDFSMKCLNFANIDMCNLDDKCNCNRAWDQGPKIFLPLSVFVTFV